MSEVKKKNEEMGEKLAAELEDEGVLKDTPEADEDMQAERYSNVSFDDDDDYDFDDECCNCGKHSALFWLLGAVIVGVVAATIGVLVSRRSDKD